METGDLALIEQHREQDPELQALWEQHVEYGKILGKFEGKPYLSPTQLEEVKQLKKKKLAGKTKLTVLLQKYRGDEE